jgi:hypothetical protein
MRPFRQASAADGSSDCILSGLETFQTRLHAAASNSIAIFAGPRARPPERQKIDQGEMLSTFIDGNYIAPVMTCAKLCRRYGPPSSKPPLA